MPVRFRCAYCNQLLGIARRKAGTIVRCPTCNGQVIVPRAEGEDDIPEPDVPQEKIVFERPDFDEVFRAEPMRARTPEKKALAVSGGATAPVPARSPAPEWRGQTERAADIDVERVEAALEPIEAQPGLVLSKRQVVLFTIVTIVALIFAFGTGLMVGLLLQPSPPSQESARR